MISNEEKIKRQNAYDVAKANSIKRGVELTTETESLMKLFVNGEIGELAFLLEVAKISGLDLGSLGNIH